MNNQLMQMKAFQLQSVKQKNSHLVLNTIKKLKNLKRLLEIGMIYNFKRTTIQNQI